MALHDGDDALAAQLLRRAVRHWREIGSPVGEAETRLRLAECLLRVHDTTGVEFELHAVESNLVSVAAAHRTRLGVLRDALRGLRAGEMGRAGLAGRQQAGPTSPR